MSWLIPPKVFILTTYLHYISCFRYCQYFFIHFEYFFIDSAQLSCYI
nr:MAG TPA: hypothetical protein [Caudoviricetes sp.]